MNSTDSFPLIFVAARTDAQTRAGQRIISTRIWGFLRRPAFAAQRSPPPDLTSSSPQR